MTVQRHYCDVLVIGGGPGGLAAAAAAKSQGAKLVILVEREDSLGGVLGQCIHEGFGIHRYQAQMTGPEYATRCIEEARRAGVTMMTGAMAVNLTPLPISGSLATVVGRDGLIAISARAVVLATGCRERTRGAISLPGTRPAGIYTAGMAQNLINTKNLMVGRHAVILGSGDIGLIMARRMSLEGAQVLAVVEIMNQPGGLKRNVRQCVQDFDIPLLLGHTVTNILGSKRLNAVEITRVDEGRIPIPGTERTIDCDTLILSVGLIPENELASCAGIPLDPLTNGVITDDCLQSAKEGIFACGNSRRVMDLADFVSRQGDIAGSNAARFIQGEPLLPWREDAAVSLPKGMPASGTVVCPLCPRGCEVVLRDSGKIEGNSCDRGRGFLEMELNCPERYLTTTLTVRGAATPLVAVRSDRPVRRRELMQLMKQLRTISVDAPIDIGQVLLRDVGENHVNIVASQSIR